MPTPRILAVLPYLAALGCFAPEMEEQVSGTESESSGSSGSTSSVTGDPSTTPGTTPTSSTSISTSSSSTSTPGSSSSDDGTSESGETTAMTGCSDASAWYPDADGDGYGDPANGRLACDEPDGFVEDDSDCDDTDPDVHPGAEEICGGPDRDCDEIAAPLCTSCLALLDTGASEDGTYTIDPDGDGELTEEEVWCDMTTDGGGWTLVQRTLWSAAQTDALMTGHDAFMYATIGDADLGFVYRLRGEAWPTLAVEAEHLLRLDLRVAADGSSCAPLRYLGTGGEITLSDDGLAIDDVDADVIMFSGTELSTADSGPSAACVDGQDAVPWFYANCCHTCPAFRGEYWPERHPFVLNYVDTTPDTDGNLGADVCPSPAIDSIPYPGHYGANVLEFYVR